MSTRKTKKTGKIIRKEKLNNKGFSMLEILIAMLILSGIVAVIYAGFVRVARINRDTRLRHKATTLAQNVMEGIKAESIEEILYQFSYPSYTDPDGGVIDNFDIIPVSMFSDTLLNSVSAAEEYMVGTALEKEKGYKKTADGKYTLQLKNVELDNSLFDVKIILDSNPYVSGNAQSRGQNYNSQQVSQIPVVDTNYDALISNCKEYDDEGWLKIQNEIGGSFVQNNAKRVIEVTIDETILISGETVSYVTVKYYYYYQTNKMYEVTDVVFDNSVSPEYELRNMFLFFRPSYGYAEDEIIINNIDDKEMNLYLVKQQLGDATGLISKENGYRAKVVVNGKESAKSLLSINTNLGTNLGNGQSVDAQAKYTYSDGTFSYTDAVANAMLGINNLADSEVKDKLMDVTVEIYQGTEKKITMTGTLLN